MPAIIDCQRNPKRDLERRCLRKPENLQICAGPSIRVEYQDGKKRGVEKGGPKLKDLQKPGGLGGLRIGIPGFQRQQIQSSVAWPAKGG
jgi:hypothetical protein